MSTLKKNGQKLLIEIMAKLVKSELSPHNLYRL